MKRRLLAPFRACGMLPMVQGYLHGIACFLLLLAALLLWMAGDQPPRAS